MDLKEMTNQQIGRAIRKVASRFPANQEASVMTDIHLRVTQESGELVAFDDDDNEITRVVIEPWIDNQDEDFYQNITPVLRNVLHQEMNDVVEQMSILRPFSFVLEDDDHEHIAELYMADGDTVIVGGEILPNLDEDLDSFFNDLLKED